VPRGQEERSPARAIRLVTRNASELKCDILLDQRRYQQRHRRRSAELSANSEDSSVTPNYTKEP